MSIYSPYDVYPSHFDEVFFEEEVIDEQSSCEEIDAEYFFNMQFLISEKLKHKGYSAVNLNYEFVDGKYQHVLEFSYVEVDKFVKNMRKLGCSCKSVPARKRRYRWVVFDDTTPMNCLIFYHHLEVIK